MADGQQILLLLDDDDDLRETLGELIALFGAVCFSVPSLAAMIAAEPEVLACRLAILDVNLGDGQPSGVDAFEWLRARSFAGQIVFLTGHALSHPAVARAATRRAGSRQAVGDRRAAPSRRDRLIAR